ncbi:MAG: hypothetical protein QXU20_00090 [Candidatus Woesearchaeota archaeon]
MSNLKNKNNLVGNLKKAFNTWKKEVNFKSSFEELDEVFFIQDYVLAYGFVSTKINRMICSRIKDTFYSWVQQIHSWLIPTPYSIISTSESQLFNDKEKEELNVILKDFMSIVAFNTEVGLTKDKQKEAEYVDKSLEIWRKHLPSLIKFSKKVRNFWEGKKQKSSDNYEIN